MTVLSSPDYTKNIPKFPGSIFYVDGTGGSNSNNGKLPTSPKLTIAAAIAAAAAGDAITVKAGTYTEDIDMNLVCLEMWGEIGANLVGTLTLSAASCRAQGMLLKPSAAIGLIVTGIDCIITDVHAEGTPTIAFDIRAADVEIDRCLAFNYTTTGFKVTAAQVTINDCFAVGAGGITRGFHMAHADASFCVLNRCVSSNNATAGYEIITGAANNTLVDCVSGKGDGRWVAADQNSAWERFSYVKEIHKIITFAGAPTTYNILKVTGSVRISSIFGLIETPIPATAALIHLELFSANGSVDITQGTGPSLISLPAGSLLVRNAPSTVDIDVADPTSGPSVAENVNWRDPVTAVDIVKDVGADTYVRLVLSLALASGVIDWHCHWEPLSDDGFLEQA